jgi:NaMN:DMB phosphoribosyltransferase
MDEKERDRVLLAMALVIDAAESLSLDSPDDRKELKRRLAAAVTEAVTHRPSSVF